MPGTSGSSPPPTPTSHHELMVELAGAWEVKPHITTLCPAFSPTLARFTHSSLHWHITRVAFRFWTLCMTKDTRTTGSHCSPHLSLTWLNLTPSPQKSKEACKLTMKQEQITQPGNPKHLGTQTMLKTLSGNQTLKLLFFVFLVCLCVCVCVCVCVCF